MSLYEKAFAEGERASWRDRQAGQLREKPNEPIGAYGVGWWDGYTPRTSAWAVRTRAVVAPVDVREYA